MPNRRSGTNTEITPLAPICIRGRANNPASRHKLRQILASLQAADWWIYEILSLVISAGALIAIIVLLFKSPERAATVMDYGREVLHGSRLVGLRRDNMPGPWHLSELGCVLAWDNRPGRALSTTIKWPWTIEVELVLG